MHLFYTVFDEYNIIARNSDITNKSGVNLEIMSAYSASLDLSIRNYDTIHFAGTWERARNMERTSLKPGRKAEIDSFGALRVRQGINPHQFRRLFKDGESFETLQSVMFYSNEGFRKPSREYNGSLLMYKGVKMDYRLVNFETIV